MSPSPNKLGANRRQVIAGVGGAAAVGLAGCAGDGGDGGDGAAPDPVSDRVTVNPDDIVEGGEFRSAIGANVDSFDYPYSSSASSTAVMNLMYEGMITTGANAEIYPWLAESYERTDLQDIDRTAYESYMVEADYDDEGVPQLDRQIVISHPDNDPSSGSGQFLTVEEAPDAIEDGTFGMRFEFSLHEGVTFHDGSEMTAADVVASYERVRGSTLSGQIYDSLLDIQADGDYTVELYAQVPDAFAILNIGGLPIYPEEKATLPPQEMDPRQGNEIAGTGPFQLDDFTNEEFFRFTAFEDYWFDTELKDWFDGPEDFPNGPAVDAVDLSIIADPASRSAALQNDELDLAYGLNSSTLTDYQESEEFNTSATNGAGYLFMQYPVRVAPFDDDRIRRAVNHLIPREDISSSIFQGWENPAYVPIPPVAAKDATTDYEAFEEEVRSSSDFDTERATELAQEAVDENDIETPIEVTIETNAENDDRVRVVQLIAESMNQTEFFDVSVETKAFNTLLQQILSPDYFETGNIVVIGLSGGFDPHGYIKAIHHPDNFAACCNFQNIDNQELNDALEQARYGTEAVSDPEVRRERYEEIQNMVLDMSANSYITHSRVVSVTRGDVRGFNTYPSTQSIFSYALYAPADEQIVYMDE